MPENNLATAEEWVIGFLENMSYCEHKFPGFAEKYGYFVLKNADILESIIEDGLPNTVKSEEDAKKYEEEILRREMFAKYNN